ncbi:Toxin FitB [Caulifigura coniformis]|uniref:Toxin FitB n=1 Tax=Caulifigura coniformis TaxID=2527983 RepID=A0A517SLU9_9PLAN|nr:type II toxin-antitoxin system VapC family toxin [Caulifigura coniformis]QDT57095.1 Toxin FitB [Caulifigura coniformis]
MIVLDTNVISELMRQRPTDVVTGWINRQPPEAIWTTTVSVFEIYHGIELHPDGKRQQALRNVFELALKDVFKSRILPFDFAAAAEAAKIARRRKQAGLSSEIRDLLIAGIVATSGATFATRNTTDFDEAGLALINPWDVQPH